MLKGIDGKTHAFAVRLYVAQLPDDPVFYEKWYDLMPQKRRERSDRFRNEADRRRCIAAYALLVAAVSELAGDIDTGMDDRTLALLKAGSLNTCEGEDGKPYFPEIPVCFNISHAGDRVAVALSHKDVGCDVERRSKNAMSVAKRFFTEDEYRFLEGLNDEKEQGMMFTGLWTLKESVVKCIGEGIRRPFGDFSLVDADGSIKKTVMLPGYDDEYHIREYESENGYCYSVCGIYDDYEKAVRKIQLRV